MSNHRLTGAVFAIAVLHSAMFGADPLGKWKVHKGSDPKQPVIALSLEAENLVRDPGGTPFRPVLSISCSNGRTGVAVFTGLLPEAENWPDTYTVVMKFDSGGTYKEVWAGPDGGMALFAPKPVLTARKMSRAQVLWFAFKPRNLEPAGIKCDVRGLDQKLGELAAACGWKI